MKSVLISIRPKWCELIASGKKTIEVRKTRPKISVPFKCYIYCTNDYRNWATRSNNHEFWIGKPLNDISKGRFFCNGKVIGEFVCDGVYENISCDCESSCVSASELKEYANGKTLYGWHVSDLKIYDEPKELGAFTTFCNASEDRCANCEHYLFDNDDLNGYRRWCDVCYRKTLTRPPQSWCYVEEV